VTRFKVVIPARYGATRLPGKPMRLLAGKPLVQHVFERAMESGAEEVVIATDDERICDAAVKFGARVCMTSPQHRSGTERLSEVAQRLDYSADDIVVNLQGDEPLLPPSLIRQVAEDLAAHSAASIATLCAPVTQAAQLFDTNVVKLVMDHAGFALYFSRAPIPWDRGRFGSSAGHVDVTSDYYRHIGLYAYRCGFLHAYVARPPCRAEQLEALEQLRALWYGYRIHVAHAAVAPEAGVDTEEDLLRVERILRDREATL
jgi:3-deoxy-manno-octulosonate cytidylyltransferase (CMP-KDO synthetase)